MLTSVPDNRRRGIAAGVAAVAALLLIQQVGVVPGRDSLTYSIQDALHGPWFTLVTLVLWWLAGRLYTRRFAPRALATLVAALAFALASEGLQLLTGRSANLWDIGLDMLGALTAFAIVVAVHSYRQRHMNRVAAFLAVALVIQAMVAYPVYSAIELRRHKLDIAPALVDFGSPLATRVVTGNSQGRVVPAPAEWAGHAGEPVLAVTFADYPWPGIRLVEPAVDFEAAGWLVIEVFLSDGEALPLTVRFGGRRWGGRAHHEHTTVYPGPNSLALPLAGAKADLDAIGDLAIHTNGAHSGKRIYIAAIYVR